MGWFERLTGFADSDYEIACSQLHLEGRYLRSIANDRTFAIGELRAPSLAKLRASTAERKCITRAEQEYIAKHLLPAWSNNWLAPLLSVRVTPRPPSAANAIQKSSDQSPGRITTEVRTVSFDFLTTYRPTKGELEQ